MVKVPQECHATKRSSQPVGGDARNLHVAEDDSKRVTEQMPADTIPAQKACGLQEPCDRKPNLLTLRTN